VPRAFKKSGKNIVPNFLWGNTGYVLGNDQKGKPENATATFAAFKNFHERLLSRGKDKNLQAIVLFLKQWHPEMAKSIYRWDEIAGKNVVFQIDGDREFIHQREEAKRLWLEYYAKEIVAKFDAAFCLASGCKCKIPSTHASIKRVLGAQSSGAAIVSFNLDSFESYGKEQNLNAPIGEETEFSYTTALNELLRKSSRQKVQVGDATTVFWAEGETRVVSFLKDILDPHDDSAVNADLRKFLEAVREGKRPQEFYKEGLNKFFILGLSPNASRLAVRFWHVSTVDELSLRIGQHFSDLRIVKTYENETDFPGMWQLLHELAPQGKIENLSPLLAGAIMRAILTGSDYPRALLSAVVGRVRAEQSAKDKNGKSKNSINYYRSALIKACLVRSARKRNIKLEVGMGLNLEEKDVGYRLGRLFAILEKIQGEAHGKATIRERYYGAASSTPVTAFPVLMKLKNHHLAKLDNKGRVVNFEKMIGEVANDIKSFPTHLKLDEQGMFALGFYHQNVKLWEKSEKTEEV